VNKYKKRTTCLGKGIREVMRDCDGFYSGAGAEQIEMQYQKCLIEIE
jgi:hypothetical protein